MRLNKKMFRAVSKACRNGDRVSRCPSTTCLLAPIKDGKPWRATMRKLKAFCKACFPEGYAVRAKCEVEGDCPLREAYNQLWGRKVIPGLTFCDNAKLGQKQALTRA